MSVVCARKQHGKCIRQPTFKGEPLTLEARGVPWRVEQENPDRQLHALPEPLQPAADGHQCKTGKTGKMGKQGPCFVSRAKPFLPGDNI